MPVGMANNLVFVHQIRQVAPSPDERSDCSLFCQGFAARELDFGMNRGTITMPTTSFLCIIDGNTIDRHNKRFNPSEPAESTVLKTYLEMRHMSKEKKINKLLELATYWPLLLHRVRQHEENIKKDFDLRIRDMKRKENDRVNYQKRKAARLLAMQRIAPSPMSPLVDEHMVVESIEEVTESDIADRSTSYASNAHSPGAASSRSGSTLQLAPPSRIPSDAEVVLVQAEVERAEDSQKILSDVEVERAIPSDVDVVPVAQA